MSIAALEAVSHSAGHDGLPAKIEQHTFDVMTLVQLTVLLGLLVLLCWPYAALVVAAATDPVVLADVTNQPRALGLVLAGWCLGIILLGVPACRCIQRLTHRRHITLTRAFVEVSESSLRGSTNWGCPLTDFTGLAHRVRTRGSGTLHELFLVHRDPQRTLLLRGGEKPNLADTHHLAVLLGVPVVPVTTLHASHCAGIKQEAVGRAIAHCIETVEGIGCP